MDSAVEEYLAECTDIGDSSYGHMTFSFRLKLAAGEPAATSFVQDSDHEPEGAGLGRYHVPRTVVLPTA